ncbi:unnamed protein product [Absidia cylindrospora]
MINKRKRPTKESESTSSDILGYGYASKIYNDKVLAQKIEDGAFLIPWQSNTDYSHWMFDRYDIRHLLDHVEELEGQPTTHPLGNDWRDTTDIECDQERYADLDSEEELLFDMIDAEDRDAHVAEKKRRRSRAATGHMYHYDYDLASPPSTPLTIADRSANIQQIAQEFNIPTSSTMLVPTNDDIGSSSSDYSNDNKSPGLAFIVETAQMIVGSTQTSNQPVNVCEIQFQVRHSHDRRYDFLNKQHMYYPFYQHVRKHLESNHQPPLRQRIPLTKKLDFKGIGGLVDYGSSSSDEDEVGEQQSQQQQRGNQTTQKIPSDVMETIDKMAASVAKVGLDLEQKIRHLRSQDPRFAFLQPHHPYHSYYQKQLGLRSKR